MIKNSDYEIMLSDAIDIIDTNNKTIQSMKKENEKLKAQLKIEQDCIDYYADLNNWWGIHIGTKNMCKDLDRNNNCGGYARKVRSARK